MVQVFSATRDASLDHAAFLSFPRSLSLYSLLFFCCLGVFFSRTIPFLFRLHLSHCLLLPPPASCLLPSPSFCKLSPRAAALFAQQNVLKVKLIYKYLLPATPTAHSTQHTAPLGLGRHPPLILNVTPGTHFDEIFRKKCLLRSKNAGLRDGDWARSYSPPASPFWPLSWRVYFVFFFCCFGRKTFSSPAMARLRPGSSRTWQMRGRRSWSGTKMLPAKAAPLLLLLFLSRRATMRGWQHCQHCQHWQPCNGDGGWSWQGTRIITDQISDISRGMNVLWCVFYFISLSYNPPANGARFPFA